MCINLVAHNERIYIVNPSCDKTRPNTSSNNSSSWPVLAAGLSWCARWGSFAARPLTRSDPWPARCSCAAPPRCSVGDSLSTGPVRPLQDNNNNKITKLWLSTCYWNQSHQHIPKQWAWAIEARAKQQNDTYDENYLSSVLRNSNEILYDRNTSVGCCHLHWMTSGKSNDLNVSSSVLLAVNPCKRFSQNICHKTHFIAFVRKIFAN